MIRCVGCGGRNPPEAQACEWCARPFKEAAGRRWRWRPVAAVTLLALVVVVVLGLFASNLMTPDVETRRALAPTPAPTVAAAPATRAPAARRTALPRNVEAEIVRTDGQGASLRREPTIQSERITVLLERSVVRIVGPEVLEDDNHTWVEVQDGNGNRGWVQSDLVRAIESATPAAGQ